MTDPSPISTSARSRRVEQPTTLLSALLHGLAAGSAAHAVQVLFLVTGGIELTTAFFLSHWLVVLAVHLGAALVLHRLFEARLWAAAVFLYPVATAMSFGAMFGFGRTGMLAFLGVIGALTLLWALAPLGKGAPLLAGIGGAALGAFISLYREAAGWLSSAGLSTTSLVLAIVAALLVAFVAGRWLHSWTSPSQRASLLMTAGALVLGATAAWLGADDEDYGSDQFAAAAAQGRPPIVLIVLDTVRAQSLEMHGYERSTMPSLAEFAAEDAVLVERSIANAPHSLATHASLFTGLYPPRHGAHTPMVADPSPPGFAYPLERSIPTIAGLLAEQGYLTIGLSSNYGPLSPDFGLDEGFAHYDASPSTRLELRRRSPWVLDPGARDWLQSPLAKLDRLPPFASGEFFMGPGYRRAEQMTDRAIDAIETAGDRPFFLFLNYFDAHAPYYPPVGHRDHFTGRDDALGIWGLLEQHREPVLRGERDLSAPEREHLRALYDGELRYLDEQLDRLLAYLKQHTRWQEMLVLITSDHGEALGEHRLLDHGVSLFEELLWVPLVIKPAQGSLTPEQREAARAARVQSVDLFPMMIEHAGAKAPPETDGAAWGIGRDDAYAWLFVEQSFLQYGEERFRRELRSAEHAGWKLIQTLPGKPLLFDLGSDPAELNDLSHSEAVRRAELEGKLRAVPDDPVALRSNLEDLSPEALQRLRSLGYIN